VVAPMADNVPLGIDFCVSRKDAERFDPAIIPVTAGKNSPSSSLSRQGKSLIRLISTSQKYTPETYKETQKGWVGAYTQNPNKYLHRQLVFQLCLSSDIQLPNYHLTF
jgi:hypothetical protein